MRISFRRIAPFVALIAFGSPVWAQAPSIGSASPRSAQPGATARVKIGGGNLAGPTQFWASFPVEATLAADVADNGKNAAELTYDLKLPADAPVGVHGIRIVTAKGVSPMFLFVIDDLPAVAQVKPNQAMASAQALTVPCGVDGSIDALTRNYYKFAAAAGQTISFEVLARRLGSPLDPMVRILDLTGRELAYSDDAPGLGGDAQLAYQFKDAGEYILEVRDIRFQGGGNFAYRLRIGDFPCVTVPYPMGARKGAPAVINFAGSHVDAVQAVNVNVPADLTTQWINVGAKRPDGRSSGFAALAVGPGEEAVEQEPNDEQAQATRVNLGANLNGRFDKKGDIDRFVFTAKMGQHYTFSGITRQQGSPTDLFLRLVKADGAQVAVAEDNGPNEGVLDFTFPADGDYTLIAEDLHRRGGSEFAYRIEVAPFQAGFDLTAAADTFNVPQEGAVSVVVTAIRKGHAGPIELSIEGAPAGITAPPTVIGAGVNATTLTLQSAGGVPEGAISRIKIVGKAKVGEADVVAHASFAGALQAAQAAMPLPPHILTETAAVAATPRPFFVLRAEPKELIFGKNLNATVKVSALRQDFVEAITIAVDPAQNGLPPGITAAVKPIDKDKNEVEIVFSANPQTPLGDFTAVLAGTGKKGNDTVVQPTPGFRLSLRAPFTLKADAGDGKLAKGGTLKVKVSAERIAAYPGPIVVTFANLPKGVTASEATIPENQKEVEVTLTAAADAQVGKVENVQAKGEGTANNQKFAEVAPNTVLNVE